MNLPPADLGAPRAPHKMRSRPQSISSDRPSTIGAGLMSPPLSVSPEAAFIAAAAASQIVTNDHDAHEDTWYDQQGIEPPSETVLVSPAALTLVNNFLDQLLFNFLAVAHSTSLSALRPAVSDVLKPKLAKDAMYQADEELREYLGGGDDEDYGAPAQAARDWDLELVWKRTRLRCMVYSSLGDMEEEDEDFYMEQENLLSGDESVDDTVSPAVAIFLTSILEFMGEQALVVAGQAAFQRMRHQYEKAMRDGIRDTPETADRIVVGEADMERIALDRTLGRLWRSWKKKIRSPIINQEASFGRPYSRESRHNSLGQFKWGSLGPEASEPLAGAKEDTDVPPEVKDGEQGATEEHTSDDPVALAASIPLPIGPDDIAEILVPGLSSYSDDEDEAEIPPSLTTRPKSMLITSYATVLKDLPSPTTSKMSPLCGPRKRANSLPTPAASTFASPPAKKIKVKPAPLDIPEKISSGSASTGSASTSGAFVSALEEKQVPAVDISPDPAHRSASPVEITPEPKEEVESDLLRPKAKRMSSAQIAAMIGNSTGARSPGLPARSPSLPATSPGLWARSPSLPPDDNHSFIDEAEEIEEFSEEPEILTTSRVSISGRSSSPSSSERSKPAITIGIPKRSASVHSVRMIEVHTPRTPVSRSRNSSADAQERSSLRGAINLSREASNLSRDAAATPPIKEEIRRASPTRKGFPFPSGKPTRLDDSISEAEEVAGMSVRSDAATTNASTWKSKSSASAQQVESQTASTQGAANPLPQQASPKRAPAREMQLTTTKVTILNPSTSSGTFFFDDEGPAAPSKSPVKKKPESPTVPARSANRPQGASTPSPTHASSIGIVSVERSSPPAARETPEPPRERPSPPRQVEKLHSRKHTDSISTISSKYKPMRASNDSTRPEDVARNFEELIQSDQTIQYTLTPENMRDMDAPRAVKSDSPVLRPKSRKGDEIHVERTRASSNATITSRNVELARAPSVSRPAGLNSQPIHEDAPLSGPVPRAPGGMASRSYSSMQNARDARVPRDSTADFASFIRATGPTGSEPTLGASPEPMSGPGVVRNMGGSITGSKQSLVRTSTNGSNPNRIRYQARDATVDAREDNSDLIDFIRRGPQHSGNPRIPRNVAPFRSTMDSDQFAAATGGRAVDASLPDIRHSAASTSITDHSIPSSINSSSALIRKDKAAPSRNGTFNEEDMMPKRKQRRARDPYAIDLSDEEDEFDEPAPRARRHHPAVEEESLADFLRNVPPPQESSPAPLAASPSRPTPKKKSSSASLMSRFKRKDSSKTAAADKNIAPRPQSSAPAPGSRAGGGRGYVPIQINMPPGMVDAYGVSSVGGGSSMMPKTSSGRVQMRKFEPREAVHVSNRATSDLAEFLRNSEPPRDYGVAASGSYGGRRM